MALNWFVYLILPPINHSRIVYLLNIKTALYTFSPLFAWENMRNPFLRENDKIILTSRKLVRFWMLVRNKLISKQITIFGYQSRRFSLPSFFLWVCDGKNYTLYTIQKHLLLRVIRSGKYTKIFYTFWKACTTQEISIIAKKTTHRPYIYPPHI